MASIDSSLVRQEIKSIIATSQALKKQVKAMFERLETVPSFYDELDEIDPTIAAEFSNLTLRKVYLTTRRHDFRVVFAHWKIEDLEHVDLLLAFPRKRGYAIDWEWLAGVLHDVKPRG